MRSLARPQSIAGAAILLGLLAGMLEQRRPSVALLLGVCLVALACLSMFGERAFPWAIVLVATAPWYPLVSTVASPPMVKQKVLCAAVAAAVLAPWLWSAARGTRHARPSRPALLLGVLFAGFLVLIYERIGSVSKMIDSQVVGFLFIGVTFLCARRFTRAGGWPQAAFFGVAVLGVFGAAAYVSAPSNRIGYFVGYPITYGALLVGLLPLALLFAYRRSRLLAALVLAGSVALLVLSESRSSWVALTVVLLLFVLLQARRGNLRALTAVAISTAIAVTLVLSTESLNRIVEQKLNPRITLSQSYTHRAWSYGYALGQIEGRPLLGAGAPGFAAEEAANRTSIGAIDNGYLSVAVDMGLIGLAAAIIPILVALYALARCLYAGLAPPLTVALALGVIGMAVVTIFYDSFYWAQIDLLLGAMGGVLSGLVRDLAAEPGAARARLSGARRLLAPASAWR